MIGEQNFCLRLDQFSNNIRTTWQQLQIEKYFCDVILACNDGQIQSHRIIVAHSSPVLKNILNKNSNQNPVIYLRGVKYKHLENLVNFMYQGEVTVAEEDLKILLDVAEDLEVKGLSEENGKIVTPSEVFHYNENKEYNNENPYGELSKQVQQNYIKFSPKRKFKIQKSTKLPNLPNPVSNDFENEIFREKKLPTFEPKQNNDVSELSKSKHNIQNLLSISDRPFSCNMCDKRYPVLTGLRRHKVSTHEGVKHPCDQCNVSPFAQKSSLRKHKEAEHEGVRYPCDKCDAKPFQFATHLRQHKASVHEGVRYPCDQCNMTPFNFQSALINHKATVHEGIRYHCDQCNISPFTQAAHLKRHQTSVHEGVRFKCNLCDYKSSQKSDLKRHTKKIHNI